MSIISKTTKWLRHSLRNTIVFPLSFVVPRNRNKWLFGSNMGFAGNAKYLLIYLMEHPEEGIRPVWIARNNRERRLMKSIGFKAFKRWSPKGLFHALTSKYYLYNSYVTDLHDVALGRAIKVNLWHGVGIKNIEYAISTGPLQKLLATDSINERINHNWHFIKPDIFLSTSPMMTRHFARCFRIPETACIESSYPRNLIFNATKSEIMRLMHRYESAANCNILEKALQFKHIYIYMPTMRDSGGDFFKSIGWDFNEISDALQASDSCMIVKTHPNTELNLSDFEKPNIFKADKNADIYPILALSDTLITDYSSVYYDYILMPEKETLLLIPDLEEYMSTDRDLAFPFNEMTGGKKIFSTSELAGHIRSAGRPTRVELEQNRSIAAKFWTSPDDDCHRLIEKIKGHNLRHGALWFRNILREQPANCSDNR